jgi:hypothetical protein
MVFKIYIIYNEYTCMSISETGIAQLVRAEWPGFHSQQGKIILYFTASRPAPGPT